MSQKTPVLVVEDDASISKLLQFKLTKEGYDVTCVFNGQEALAQLDAKPWAVIVLDVMMPVMDGWEALKRIRSDDRYARLPILMLTARGNQQDISAAAEFGATEYLRKPFDPAEFAAVVKRLVGGA